MLRIVSLVQHVFFICELHLRAIYVVFGGWNEHNFFFKYRIKKLKEKFN